MNISEKELITMSLDMLKIAGGYLIGLGISTSDIKKGMFGIGIGVAILFVRNL